MNAQSPYLDTIFALASPAGIGGVAVVRVSGAAAQESLTLFCDKDKAFPPRQAVYSAFHHPRDGRIIDKGLAVLFPAPHSFTGETVVEYYLHGGVAVYKDMLAALAEIQNFRLAEPGEFTRRAFENGKLDLTEAEAVADLIHAQTNLQKQQALGQLSGSLSSLYSGWTTKLKALLAHMEADIEFPDEDLPEDVGAKFAPDIEGLLGEIENHLSDARRGERLRDGIHVALVGAPNAGKSSILNILAQRDAAIVSDVAGTTRDIIDVHLDIGGFPVILSDTAGLRPDQIGASDQDVIEGEGIRRALECAHAADILVLVFDAQALPDLDPHSLRLSEEHKGEVIVLFNKSESLDEKSKENAPIRNGLFVSALKARGFDDFMMALQEKAEKLAGLSEAPSLTRERHRKALEQSRDSLLRALSAPLPELMAEDVRLAVRYIGQITGKVDVEDVLDVIFGDFCIGK